MTEPTTDHDRVDGVEPAGPHGRRCPATNRRGSQCGRFLAEGEVVCRFHGGAAPAALVKAAQRRAEARALAILADLDHVEPCSDPVGDLLGIAGQSVKLCDLLRGVVAQLEEVSYRGGIGAGQEQLRGELAAYLSALQRAESVLSRVVGLGLEERRVRVSERQVEVLAAAVDAALRRLGLDAGQQASARLLLAEEIGRRSGGAVAETAPSGVRAELAPVTDGARRAAAKGYGKP